MSEIDSIFNSLNKKLVLTIFKISYWNLYHPIELYFDYK